jgi:hypothetical protein
MEEDNEEYYLPECPFCDDSSGDCAHVLLDYDASFMEFKSGYLASSESQELENLKEFIYDWLNLGVELETSKLEYYTSNIWDYAQKNFNPDEDEIEFDYSAYFNLLEDTIDNYGGASFRYEDDDGPPGYSSAYIIFYAKNPKETIEKVNEFIFRQLASNIIIE